MDIICAWCKKKMGEKDGGENDDLVTSSICSECKDKMLRENARSSEKTFVTLIASMYRWDCPHCDAYNGEMEIPSREGPVFCKRCGRKFQIKEVKHARG